MAANGALRTTGSENARCAENPVLPDATDAKRPLRYLIDAITESTVYRLRPLVRQVLA